MNIEIQNILKFQIETCNSIELKATTLSVSQKLKKNHPSNSTILIKL